MSHKDGRVVLSAWGTQAQNVADCVAKGRAYDGAKALRGEANPSAKLTEQGVRSMRSERATGVSIRDIAAKHGVSPGQTKRVLDGLAWAHVGATPSRSVA